MIEKLLNYFGYVKKSKQHLQQTDVIGSVNSQKFVPRDTIGVCYRCGRDAIWNAGLFGRDKLCNNCHDRSLGLD